MRDRLGSAVAAALSAACLLASSASALKRVPIRDTVENPAEGWVTGATCAIIYYNRCNLWSYGWSGFGNGDRIGVHVEDPVVPSLLTSTSLRVFSAYPSGWGFTGSVGIHSADANGCPTGPALGLTSWLPQGPFDTHQWGLPIYDDFAVVYSFNRFRGGGLKVVIGTDHPAAGPTGPPACGFCYPLDRPNHSYQWGSIAESNCPGVPFFDGVCDAQLRVDVLLACPDPVTQTSWAKIKSLYR